MPARICCMNWDITPEELASETIPSKNMELGRLPNNEGGDCLACCREHDLLRQLDLIRASSEVGCGDACFWTDELAYDDNSECTISPLIAPYGLTLLTAACGTGKTWLALYSSFEVATGNPFVGIWGKASPCKCLYVAAEENLDENRFARRVAAMNKFFGLTGGQRIPLKVAFQKVNLYTDAGRDVVDLLLADLEADESFDCPIGMVVIDSLTSMVWGTGSAQGWSGFYDWSMKLKAKGIALLVVSHALIDGTGKGASMKDINADRVIHAQALTMADLEYAAQIGMPTAEDSGSPEYDENLVGRACKASRGNSFCISLKIVRSRHARHPEDFLPVTILFDLDKYTVEMVNSEDCI